MGILDQPNESCKEMVMHGTLPPIFGCKPVKQEWDGSKGMVSRGVTLSPILRAL